MTARKRGRPPGATQRWQDRREVLGTAPDQDLAAQWGCSRQRVAQMRRHFGIAAFSRVSVKADPPAPGAAKDAKTAYGQDAYQLVCKHGGVRAAAEASGVSRSTLSYQARAYATRNNQEWPIYARSESRLGLLAYNGFMEEGKGWAELGTEFLIAPLSARTLAYRYAERNDLPRPNPSNRDDRQRNP